MLKSDDDLFSPIEQAIMLGALEDFKLALDSVNKDEELGQAVIDAAAYGNVEMLRMLHDRNADFNVGEGVALTSAAGNGHVEALVFLIDHCANAHEGYFQYAFNSAMRQAVDVLCPDAPQVKLRRRRSTIDESRYLQIVKTLIDAGANAHRGEGSMVRRACHRGPLALVDLLLKSGVDLALEGTTFLHAAEWRGDPDVIERLLDEGLNPYDTQPHLPLCRSLFDARALRQDVAQTSGASARPAFRRSSL